MKNSDVYSRLGELSLKYARKCLTIDFEFDRFGLTLKGWLDLTLNHCDIFRYNREYSYETIESLSDDIDIENLVDEFKEEVFEQYKARMGKAESER